MRIERRFTKAGQSRYAEIEFRKAVSEIKNPDGSIVFRLADIDVPAQFSQVAADILAQKYFRKAGVPKIFAALVDSALPFLAGGQPTLSQTLVSDAPESMIADLMGTVEAAWEGLSVGSYPYFRAGAVGTSIVLRTASLADLGAAAGQIAEGLTAQGYKFEDQGVSNPADLS